MSKVVQMLTENFDFRGHLSTFGSENSIKSGHLRTKKNAKTFPKQLSNNFVKDQNTTFSTPKIAKTRVPIWQ